MAPKLVKLPKQLDPVERLCGRVFEYRDAVALLDDVRRLRRATGWPVTATLGQNLFSFVLTAPEGQVSLTINAQVISQELWSLHYGGDPGVDKLRKQFLDNPTKGLAEIVQDLNQIQKDRPWIEF